MQPSTGISAARRTRGDAGALVRWCPASAISAGTGRKAAGQTVRVTWSDALEHDRPCELLRTGASGAVGREEGAFLALAETDRPRFGGRQEVCRSGDIGRGPREQRRGVLGPHQQVREPSEGALPRVATLQAGAATTPPAQLLHVRGEVPGTVTQRCDRCP
jgi:hypothetical protein